MRRLIFIMLILLFSGMSMAANTAPLTDAPLTGMVYEAQTALPDMRLADNTLAVTFTAEYRIDEQILNNLTEATPNQVNGKASVNRVQNYVFTVPRAAGELQSADRAYIRKIPKPPLAAMQFYRHY